MLGSPCSPCCDADCRQSWLSVTAGPCVVSASGRIPKRDAATLFGPGAAHGVSELPSGIYSVFRNQAEYSFSTYTLALNAGSSVTYWVDKASSPQGYPYGRARFVGGDGRCGVTVDAFVVPADAWDNSNLVGIDGFDLTPAERKPVGGCVLCCRTFINTRYDSFGGYGAPASTGGTVGPLDSLSPIRQYSYRKAIADGYRIGSDSSLLSNLTFTRYLSPAPLLVGAFNKTAELPSGAAWQSAFEYQDSWVFPRVGQSQGMVFRASRVFAMSAVPFAWQQYNHDQTASQVWASDIVFYDRAQYVRRGQQIFGPFPSIGYTPAAEFYGQTQETLPTSLPVTVSFE